VTWATYATWGLAPLGLVFGAIARVSREYRVRAALFSAVPTRLLVMSILLWFRWTPSGSSSITLVTDDTDSCQRSGSASSRIDEVSHKFTGANAVAPISRFRRLGHPLIHFPKHRTRAIAIGEHDPGMCVQGWTDLRVI
jgi:hypothetical protein